MLGAFPNMIILIMHHQACLLLARSLLRPDKSSASFNPLTGAHAHTCKLCLSTETPKSDIMNGGIFILFTNRIIELFLIS